LVESTNKNLIKIINKNINDHQINWHLALQNAMWADRVTPKSSIGNSPFFLVYGQEATVATHNFLPTLQLAQTTQDEAFPVMHERLNMLLKLEEEREKAKMKLTCHQEIIKKWFDKSVVSNKYFLGGRHCSHMGKR
jgi:hypothetical protein